MTPNEKLILVRNYIQQAKLNCTIEYVTEHNIFENKDKDTYVLIIGFKDIKCLDSEPKIYKLDEHIKLKEITEIQKILNTENISFSLIKREDFSIKLSLVMY